MSDETAQTPGTPQSDDGEDVVRLRAPDRTSGLRERPRLPGFDAPDSERDEPFRSSSSPSTPRWRPEDVEAAVVVPPRSRSLLSRVAEPESRASRCPQEPVVAAPAEPRAVQTVFVREPLPPARKGNRAVGSLIALGSAVIFAVIYAGSSSWSCRCSRRPGRRLSSSSASSTARRSSFPCWCSRCSSCSWRSSLNRAGWWAYVLGSLVVGILVYLVSIGVLLLLNNVIGMTPSAAARAFRVAAESPLIITAALVAREVSLWMGAAIAARGRRVKAKNAEARAAFDSESARARAEYERAVAANASA